MVDYTVVLSDETGSLDPAHLATIETAVHLTLRQENAGPAEISIAILGDDAIARINRDYLAHDGPTDVISFPLTQPGLPLIGDIYIGADQARRQSAEHSVSLPEELARLAIHGTLHVLGWDHAEGESSPMYARQEKLVKLVLS